MGVEKEPIDRLLNEYKSPEEAVGKNGLLNQLMKTSVERALQVEIELPRERQASFEPRLERKGETRFSRFDNEILSLYAHGFTTREIQDHLEEMYLTEVPPTLISNVTEAVIEQVKAC